MTAAQGREATGTTIFDPARTWSGFTVLSSDDAVTQMPAPNLTSTSPVTAATPSDGSTIGSSPGRRRGTTSTWAPAAPSEATAVASWPPSRAACCA